MKVLLLLLAALALPGLGSAQRKQKPPEVEVLEAKARREGDRILVDGRLRVSAEKPLRGVVVIFDLMAPESNVVGTQKAVLDDQLVRPGEERSWHSETSEHVRAVRFRIRASDAGDRELRVGNAGPFPIE